MLTHSCTFLLIVQLTAVIYGAPADISSWWQPPHTGDMKIVAAPLPPNARNEEPLPGKTYFYQKLADGVYWIAKGAYCSMFVVTDKGVIVIDAPPAIGQDIVAAIKDVTDKPATHLIYSHMHSDHIGAATLFKNVEIIGHEETATLLKKVNDPDRPVPSKTFSDTLTLNIDGKTIQLDYKGPIHFRGNIFVWLPKEKILFSVDVLHPGWAPFTRLGMAQDVLMFIEAPDIILSYPFDKVVSAHFGRLATKTDVLEQKEYMRDVQQNAITAASQLNLADYEKRAADPKNFASWYDAYSRDKARICFELTAKKWMTRLGGVDIYTYSNCDIVSENQNIYYGMKVLG